jgi:hypothetical protein
MTTVVIYNSCGSRNPAVGNFRRCWTYACETNFRTI